ncbi:amine sulfotransferase-like [Triplophysa dalaica]|uniref:amine sulfotransferase-like n=1 Tax=Triplophysa dalaica TaxID=1582913 RepID=UPI0024DF5F86|nr:amine sulfotransferase-like [Triplophysa dalaica]
MSPAALLWAIKTTKTVQQGLTKPTLYFLMNLHTGISMTSSTTVAFQTKLDEIPEICLGVHFANIKKNMEFEESYDELVDKFFTERMVAGCWFDHIRGWISNKDKYNIMILTYEEMMLDLRSVIVKTCKFVGKNLSDEAIDKVVEKAFFNTMKKNRKANHKFLSCEYH